MSNGYNAILTLDRIDVNGNYEPSNCRWVSQNIQQANKRNNNEIVGVSKHHKKGYNAYISVNGIHHAKYFLNMSDAIRQRKEWENEYGIIL